MGGQEPEPAKRSEGKRKLVLLASASCVISAVLLDHVGGALFDLPTIEDDHYQIRAIRLREYRPNRDFKPSPTARVLGESEGLRPGPYRLRTDAQGFIMPSRKHENPDVVLAFLGGSTTECYWVEEQNRFPYLAGELLEKQSHLKVNSYNGAMSGNTTTHSLNILHNKVMPLRPDAVVMMHNINDLVTLRYYGSYWNNSPTRSPLLTIERKPSLRGLLGYPLLVLMPHTHYAMGKLTHKLKTKYSRRPVDEFAGKRGSPSTISHAEALAEFSKNVRTFVAMCRIRGIIPVLMTQQGRFTEDPSAYVRDATRELEDSLGVSYDEFRRYFDDFNDEIRAIGIAEQVRVVDLYRAVPKTPEFFYDLDHFNDKGSVAAAKVIAQALQESLAERVEPAHVSSRDPSESNPAEGI